MPLGRQFSALTSLRNGADRRHPNSPHGGRSPTRDSLAPLLLDFMSFGEKSHLLRAIPLSSVLRRGAQILSTSAGQPQSYALSTPVRAIDAFLSHNWQVGRWTKYIGLCWTYNIGLALAACAISQVLMFSLTASGVFPTFDSKGALHRDRHYPRTWVSDVTAVPAFLGTLLLGGSLRRLLGLRDPMIFLDKTCIDQHDKELQRQGVKKLGAFLAQSKCMLVLYSHIYLTRLWTVYEIACFLSLHPVSRLSLIPTIQPVASLLGLLLTFFVRMLATFLVVAAGFHHFAQQVVFLLMAPLIAALFRFLARERETMRKQLSCFAVRCCICTCEEDREVVYNNISGLMRTTGVVGTDCDQEAALDAFDVMVREELPEVLEEALNCSWKQYLLFVLWASSSFAPPWIGKLIGLCYGLPFSIAIADSSMTLVFIFAWCPLNFLLINRLVQWRLDWRGRWELLLVVMSGWLSIVLGAIVWESLVFCWLTSNYPGTGDLDGGALLTTAVMVSMGCVCAWVFIVRDTPCNYLRRRLQRGLPEAVKSNAAPCDVLGAKCEAVAVVEESTFEEITALGETRKTELTSL